MPDFRQSSKRTSPGFACLAAALALACCLFTAAALPASAQQAAPARIPVGTVAAEKRSIDRTADFVGRVDVVNRVDIRARVTGYLEEVLFQDGQFVKEGMPLYRTERGPFEAAVEQGARRARRYL